MHYTLGDPAHTALLIACRYWFLSPASIHSSGTGGVLWSRNLFQFHTRTLSRLSCSPRSRLRKSGKNNVLKIHSNVNDAVGRVVSHGSITFFFPRSPPQLGWTTDAIWTLQVITFVCI